MENLYDTKGIEEGLRSIRQMIPTGDLSVLTSILDDSVKRLNEPMQLAIIGKISSSKSTLVNAILGKNEVMATGQKEVTYNVGWLKYGKPDSDIILHHKDGSPNTTKSQKEFASWTTENNHAEIDNISYIETFDDAEILRELNIIDTPGLDALRGKDSQNTLDFIKNVRPDAIIMLFTHSVAENVLDIVSQFNAGSSFSPLNALGILSKIDVLWQESLERNRTALQIGQKMASNRMRKDTMLRKTLFNIYPISALLFLASSTLNESVWNDIKQLAKSDLETLRKALNSTKRFVDPQAKLTLEVCKRENLIASLGLYGVYVLLEMLANHSDANVQDAKNALYNESGAKDFVKVLHNHFGSRAKLIKLESIYQNIQQTIMMLRGRLRDITTLQMLSKIEQRVNDLFSSLVHEHREYELLNRIYADEIYLDADTRKEFLRLCGENGTSALERLGIEQGATPKELIEMALEHERYWRKCVALEPDPEEREWMNVMLTSYSQLRQKLQSMIYQYEQAKAFLFND